MVRRVGTEGRAPKRHGFVYKPRSVEDVRRRAERQSGRFDSILKQGFDMWRPKAGENVIRILPPTWGEHDHYGYSVFAHRFVGPDNSTYLCPFKMEQKKCPICQAAKDAKAHGEEEEEKALRVQELILCWVIDRNEEGLGKHDAPTPQVFQMSFPMDRDLAALCHSKRTGEILLIDHPEKGYDVIIRRTGQGLKTRYVMEVDREDTPILDDEKQQEELLAFIEENPIPSLLKLRDAQFLENIISGNVDEGDEELDADEDGEEERPRRGGRRRPADDDEDERPPRSSRRRGRDGDEDDQDPPFDEDEEPRGRGRGRGSKTRDDDDEDARPARPRLRRPAAEDEDEERPARSSRRRRDEDEEDERPRSRRGKPADEDEDEELIDDAELEDTGDDDGEGDPPPRSRRSKPEPVGRRGPRRSRGH